MYYTSFLMNHWTYNDLKTFDDVAIFSWFEIFDPFGWTNSKQIKQTLYIEDFCLVLFLLISFHAKNVFVHFVIIIRNPSACIYILCILIYTIQCLLTTFELHQYVCNDRIAYNWSYIAWASRMLEELCKKLSMVQECQFSSGNTENRIYSFYEDNSFDRLQYSMYCFCVSNQNKF